jgi:tetratricopeptide (TPR) repeat protein
LEEKEELKQRITENPLLNREFALRNELNLMGMEDEILSLRAKLNMAKDSAVDYEKESTNRFTSSRTKRLVYAAATVTGIALGSWAIIAGGDHGVRHETLYSENFTPYPPVIIYRDGSMDDYDKGFLSTMNLYYGSKYNLASKQLEELLEDDPKSITIKFYLAVTYMQLEEYAKSRNLFDEIIRGESFFVEQAIWYKGLGYLAEKNTEKALETLKELHSINGQYAAKAAHLIEQINRD